MVTQVYECKESFLDTGVVQTQGMAEIASGLAGALGGDGSSSEDQDNLVEMDRLAGECRNLGGW